MCILYLNFYIMHLCVMHLGGVNCKCKHFEYNCRTQCKMLIWIKWLWSILRPITTIWQWSSVCLLTSLDCVLRKRRKITVWNLLQNPPHSRHVDTLPWEIKNSNFLQIIQQIWMHFDWPVDRRTSTTQSFYLNDWKLWQTVDEVTALNHEVFDHTVDWSALVM